MAIAYLGPAADHDHVSSPNRSDGLPAGPGAPPSHRAGGRRRRSTSLAIAEGFAVSAAGHRRAAGPDRAHLGAAGRHRSLRGVGHRLAPGRDHRAPRPRPLPRRRGGGRRRPRRDHRATDHSGRGPDRHPPHRDRRATASSGRATSTTWATTASRQAVSVHVYGPTADRACPTTSWTGRAGSTWSGPRRSQPLGPFDTTSDHDPS